MSEPSRIDLLRWPGAGVSSAWPLGEVRDLEAAWQQASVQVDNWARTSSAQFGLFWGSQMPPPDRDVLKSLVALDVDIAHAGLLQGLGNELPDLDMVLIDWTTINAPPNESSCSWRVGLDTVLVRRSTWTKLGGLDGAYRSPIAAGLDWGRRALHAGAVIEHRPELVRGKGAPRAPSLEPHDIYTFVLRHHGARWGKYVMARRALRGLAFQEPQHFATALATTREIAPPKTQHAWQPLASVDDLVRDASVSVIIPTLGRYPYLPGALESLRRQTVRPREVIVVDQNPPEAREPRTYERYEDLNLRVIWQDERGQSLARNTALAEVAYPYVFLFDDDSIAHDDLIEQHLRVVLAGRFDVSTGVAFPPPPTDYQLPAAFTFPRVAQTFDSGNSLMSIDLVREMGGFDRNYDFGPGTDTDLGTRMYLAGKRIAHNPSAVRIHFKAPSGGLRVHGAHKYNTDASLLGPFPPTTQSYYGSRYLEGRQRFERTLLMYATSKLTAEQRRGDTRAYIRLAFNTALLPIKWWRSDRRARALLAKGVRTERFTERTQTDDSDR